MSRSNPATTHDNAGIAAWRFSAPKINSYEEADAFLGDEIEKKCGRGKLLIHRLSGVPGDGIAVRLYDTDILIYYQDGTFEADNGGWNTPTTTARLNYFAPPGWFFGHGNKKLYGNGRPMGKGLRYAVHEKNGPVI